MKNRRRLSTRQGALAALLLTILGTLVLVPWRISAQPALLNQTSLPKVGAWVRYHVTKKVDGGSVEDSPKLTISVVGQKIEEGVPCLWVELKFVGGERGENSQWLFKCLIPERALLEEERPMQHVIRAWEKFEGQAVHELPTGALKGDKGARRFVSLDEYMVFWPGSLRTTERVETRKTLDYQQGRLVIPEGRRGKFVEHSPGAIAEEDINDTTEYQVWLHHDLPIGFACAQIRFTSADETPTFPNSTTEYTAEDAGAGAKSVLPDHD